MQAACLLVWLCLGQLAAGSETTDLHLMHISCTWLSVCHLPSIVDLAVDMINNRTDLLQGYTLHVHHSHAEQFSKGQVMKAFIDQVSQPPTKLLIIGPTFSSEAQVVAETAAFYNLVQIGYTTTSPVLSDPAQFPLFARTMENTVLHTPAILQVLQYFRWAKVAKLTTDIEYVIATSDRMQQMLDSNNITTLASSMYTQNPQSQIKHIKSSGAKIILAFTTLRNGAVRPFCRAYKEDMYGEHYQWIHWSTRHGLLSQYDGSTGFHFADDCTDEQVRQAAEGVISFEPMSLSQTDSHFIKGISGYTFPEVQDKLKQYMAANNLTPGYLLTNTFDAAWAAALALNDVILKGLHPENFYYNDSEFANNLFNTLTNVQFNGTDGLVAFDENGDRNNIIIISQIQNGARVTVGTYSPFLGAITFNNETPIKFYGGIPPLDSDIVLEVTVLITQPLRLVMTVLAALGILCCILCITFNIRYRDIKLVKLSSPRINTLIAVGCCLSYLTIILQAVQANDTTADVICVVKNWTIVFGFTFAFGSMFSKTWRVHVLFTNKKLTRKVVKDKHLFGIVFGAITIDAIIMITWLLIDPAHWELVYLHEQQEHTDNHHQVTIIPKVYVCRAKYTSYFGGVLYAFKALLLIFGIFFAWETRKVQIEALNDSRQIGMCVYNVMIMSAVGVPMVNLLSIGQVSISFAVCAVAILVCATTTLGLVFGSKVMQIWQQGSTVDVAVLPFAASLQRTNTLQASTIHSATDSGPYTI